MAYNDEKIKGYRQAVTIVEIDLDINDPAIDFSGDPTSYNTPKTTNDNGAYKKGAVQTYVLTNQQLEFGVTHFPCVDTVTSSPAVLKPGNDVALSASATIKLKDFNTNDVFELPEPYENRRVTGSFFGKLLARNYLINREVRVKRGYNPESLDDANFQIEHYVIKSVGSLDSRGNISISLIDRLFFTTESKAKAPQVTSVKLLSSIGNLQTSLTFSGDNFGDKAKDRIIQAGDTGTIKIDNEMLGYTVDTFNGTTGTLTISRGQQGTTAEAHDADLAIQGCFVAISENITDINRRLIRDFTDIDDIYIDDAKWDAEKAGDLSSFNLTNYITEPVDVNKLMKETIVSTGSWIYFDTILNEIIIGSSPRFDLPVLTLDEDNNILQDSLRYTPQSSLQVTRSTIRYNKSDYTQNDDARYYPNAFQKIDGNAESDAQYSKQSEAKEIKTNWYTGSTTDIAIANSVSQLKVERFRDIPNSFTVNLDSANVGDLPNLERLWYGSVIDIKTRQLLNPDASLKTTTAQVVSVKPNSIEDTWQITALSYNANIPTNVDLYIESDSVDLLLTDLLTITEAREYVVVINSGVKITSSSLINYAFDTGVFLAGASLKLINQGFIAGKGGKGGDGAQEELPEIFPQDGGTGGNALNIQVDTTLDNLTGLIGGGGGGGGGGGADSDDGLSTGYGGGGGGGANLGDFGISLNLTYAENGEIGSFDFGGTGGNSVRGGQGGTGGGLGEPGSAGFDGSGAQPISEAASGGISGDAIHTNGNALVIISGNNSEQIRGGIV